jgi:RNA polymerase sigma-70 factor (ECF subfamily)
LDPEQASDEWLMARVAQRERRWLEGLIHRYATPLLTFIARMLADHHRGEELFQEVWLAVWMHRDQYRPEQRFKPWLFQITANKCREAMRGKKLSLVGGGEPGGLLSATPGDTADPSETAAFDDESDRIVEAIQQLPEQQRDVVANADLEPNDVF